MFPLQTPESYAKLPFRTIRVSHVPDSSPSPTPVVLITLYRPGRNNSFTDEMMEDIEKVFTLLDMDERVKCIVVTGHGKNFCAGADLGLGFRKSGWFCKEPKRWVNLGHDQNQYGLHEAKVLYSGGRASLAIHRCRKPTIGAINGSAVGVGITMTLPMTIRVVSSSAKIGFVFARRGIVMEACSSYFLPRLIGYARALHLVTTGAVYSSNDPLLSGLFSEVVEQDKVLPRSLALAEEIATNTSVVSTTLMREMIWRSPDSAEGAHLLESQLLHDLFEGPDNKEGVAAFMEKRIAKFKASLENNAPTAYPWWSPIDTLSPADRQLAPPKSKI